MTRLYRFLQVLNYLYGLFGFGVMCALMAPIALPLALAPAAWRLRARPLVRDITYRAFVFVRWHCQVAGFATMRLVDHRAGQTSHVYLANHLTMFDIVLLFSFVPQLQTLVNAKFLANPLLWPIVRACGYIPVRVGQPGDGVRAFNEAAELIACGELLVLFPEGTRSATGGLGALSLGPFRLASAGRTAPSFVFFTCNQPFLNRAAFFPKKLGRVVLEAHIMPPVPLTSAGEVPSAAALRELFIAEHAAFCRSAQALAWNRPKSP